MFHIAFYRPCHDKNTRSIHWLSLLILMWFPCIGGGIRYMQVVLPTFQRCYLHIEGELQNTFTFCNVMFICELFNDALCSSDYNNIEL
jgi:hypothetical protein